jgi:hypothetical protein
MDNIQISLIASANRVDFWPRFYNSLCGNTINWEIIFVGDTAPKFSLADNFRWIHATVKPAQCYEIGFRAARGELIHWTADDADYDAKGYNCPNCLDRVYKYYKEFCNKYGDEKTIIALRPIEDGGDVWDFHHFFGGWHETPVMAPFGIMNREWFHKLGGYDKNFVSGQSENDVVMRGYEDGGRVEICMDCFVYVHHRQVHPRHPTTGKEVNKFRAWYPTDREYLEKCWVVGGYGYYEKQNAFHNIDPSSRNPILSKTRLLPIQRFDDINITTLTQGPRGIW